MHTAHEKHEAVIEYNLGSGAGGGSWGATLVKLRAPAKLSAPAAGRNREPVLSVLERVLPQGVILEIASGSGEHAVYFAGHLEHVQWQPSDIDASARESVSAWFAEAQLPNLRAPIKLDVRSLSWPLDEQVAGIVCINMVHISPWACCQALFAGATRTVSDNGVVYLYGPYRIKDRETAPSNERFDQWLQSQNPAWGLRWLHEVEQVAESNGFALEEVVNMPANNVSVVFRRHYTH